MNYYVNYFAEANIALILFYVIYWLLLRNETNFRFKRFYLLVSITFSLLFPLIEIGDPNNSIPSLGRAFSAYFLPEVVIGQPEKIATDEVPAVTILSIVTWIYLAVISLLGIFMAYQIVRLCVLLKRSAFRTAYGSYRIVETPQNIPAFSFFNYIVLGMSDSLSIEEKSHIIKHEMVHAQKLHSLDLITVELVKILFWFNPVIYLIKKSISDVHEFQADEKVVNDVDMQTYCSLLARISLQSAGFSFANHFNKSLTVKRITMMKSIKKKMKLWKFPVIIIATTSLFITIACQEQVMDDINTVVQNSSASLNIPPDVQAWHEALQKENPDSKFLVIELNEAGKKKLEEIESTYGLPKSIFVSTASEENKTLNSPLVGNANKIIIESTKGTAERPTYLILEYSDQVKTIAQQTAVDDVFTIVEENATPGNGIEEFYKFIAANIRYPEEAKRNGISGRVFIEFIVEKDGTLSELKAAKGIGYGCDEEAMRVLAMSPAWIPAKQRGRVVKQKMVLPILFNNAPKADQEISNVNQVIPVKQKMNVKIESIEVTNGKTVISGKVTDEQGTGLKDTNIIVKNTTYGTVTDQHGRFTIALAKKGEQLAFSHVGFDMSIQGPF